MKKKTVLLIVLICFGVFVLFGVASCFFVSSYIKNNGSPDFSYSSKGIEETQNQSVSLEGVDTIVITGVSDEITLTASAGDMLTSELNTTQFWKASKLTLDSHVAGTTAYVEVVYPTTSMHMIESELNVGIPADFSGSVKIIDTAGSVSGDISNSLSSLSMFTTSGRLQLSLNRVGDVHLESVSGGIDFKASVDGALTAKTVSGEVDINGPASSSASVSVETISGSVDVTYFKACPTKISTTSGAVNIKLIEDVPIHLAFSSTAGSIRGETATDPDGVEFKITTISSDLSFE